MADLNNTPLLLEKEEWRDVPGFEGFYQASQLGRIRSFHRCQDGTLIKATKYGKYAGVWLCGHGKQRRYYVHDVIAMTFLGKKPNGYEVNHKDTSRFNNRADNLEYLTSAEHHRHTRERGLLPSGAAHWSRRRPECVARGDEHWTRRMPHLVPRGEKSARSKRPESYPVGTAHYKAKFTEGEIRNVIEYLKEHTQYEAGARFGVSQATISRLYTGSSYKSVPR